MPDQQEEIYQDIVANTNPVIAELSVLRQVAEANMYINPSQAFFSAKQNLLRYSTTEDLAPITRKHSFASFCSDNDRDKIEFENESDALENLSDFIDELDRDFV